MFVVWIRREIVLQTICCCNEHNIDICNANNLPHKCSQDASVSLSLTHIKFFFSSWTLLSTTICVFSKYTFAIELNIFFFVEDLFFFSLPSTFSYIFSLLSSTFLESTRIEWVKHGFRYICVEIVCVCSCGIVCQIIF